MQLLVSVRSSAEVAPAVSGGADIIDAKEPSQGSLGAVTLPVLTEILARIPRHHGASIALGDLNTTADVLAAVSSVPLRHRQAPTYLKVGLAGVSSPEQVRSLLETAVTALRERSATAGIIAVGYVDAERVQSVSPQIVSQVAALAGAAGVLLDTAVKDGRGLLHWIQPAVLTSLLSEVRAAGLLTALAGGLGLEDLSAVHCASPDVLGVRGAACIGGREGTVSQARVQQLRLALLESDSGFLPGSGHTAEGGSRNA